MTTPANVPGAVDVVVSKSGSTASRSGGFVYLPVPPLLRPVGVSGNQVTLDWAAGSFTPVRGFYLMAGRSPGSSEFGPYPQGLATHLTTLVSPGRYYARIVADTVWGLLTSNEMTVAVGVPSVPGPPTLAPAVISGRTVSLSWSLAPSASSYVVVARLQPGGAPVAVMPVAASTLVVPAPPGVYYVSVVAVNATGVGPESNQVTVTVN